MGNSNIELDTRLQRIERKLENYQSSIEPKSGEFTGQNWYNTSTEVLNVWNGREFTPAYGKSIISDLNGFETRITQNEFDIEFSVVQNDQVISAINLSSEGVNILGNKITLDGDVTVTGAFTLDYINDGSTYKRVTSNEKTGAGRGYSALNSSNRYSNWLTNGELSPGSNPTNGIIMDSAGIRGYKSTVKQFEIDTSGNAYFRGEIAADTGYIKTLDIDGTLTMNASTGIIQSSDYDTINGWRIDNDGMYVGQGKNISLYYDGAVYATHHGYGVVLNNGGIDFYSYIGSNNGSLTYYDQDVIILGTTVNVEGILATQSFIVNDKLLVNGISIFQQALVLENSADLYLMNTGTRIKNSDSTAQIYYNGTNWRILDSTGIWRDL